MKLLLDSCVYGGAVTVLEEEGHDVVWSGEWPSDPRDAEILNTAISENRVLITLDKDFGEMAITQGIKHCGIVRLVNISAVQQETVCDQVLALHGIELEDGALITVEPGRLRIRLEEA